MNLTFFNILPLFAASSDFFLSICCCHNSYPSLLLLICDGPFGTFTGTSIGLASLATDGQTLSVAQAAVAADLGQTLDVQSGLTTQVAFHNEVVVNALADFCLFLVGEVFYSGVGVDPGHIQDLLCAGPADSVDISESDLDSLVFRQVNAGYTCHTN